MSDISGSHFSDDVDNGIEDIGGVDSNMDFTPLHLLSIC